MAVLPTPGSPISAGLFFERRDNTCITLLISLSRPITGSNSLFLAFSVKLTPNSFSAALDFLLLEFLTCCSIFFSKSFLTSESLSSSLPFSSLLFSLSKWKIISLHFSAFSLFFSKIFAVIFFSSFRMPNSKCSVPT